MLLDNDFRRAAGLCSEDPSRVDAFEEAAKVAGIGKQTLLRYLKRPEFKAAYLEARREAVSQSSARLQQASGAAVSTLFKVMVDVNTPASTRVRAADCVLKLAKDAIVSEDIIVRVAAVEQIAKRSEGAEGNR